MTSREAKIEAGVTWAIGIAGLAMGMARYRPWMNTVEKAVDYVKERYHQANHDIGQLAVAQEANLVHLKLVEPEGFIADNVVAIDFSERKITEPPRAA